MEPSPPTVWFSYYLTTLLSMSPSRQALKPDIWVNSLVNTIDR
jgi:hypothetical protein